jgi:flavin reductase (DIM6/NTAB) family NADH-FMN oxidoreductase RutF
MTELPTAVALEKAYRLLNHGPVTLITSAHGGARNVMAASWVMAIDFFPLRLAAVIDLPTYTRELIDASGCFGVNLPRRALAQATYDAGQVTGRGRDKLADLGLDSFPATTMPVPLLHGCAGWLECTLIDPQPTATDPCLLVARVTAAWADADMFRDGRWQPEAGIDTIHYVAGGVFFPTGAPFQVRTAPSTPAVD